MCVLKVFFNCYLAHSRSRSTPVSLIEGMNCVPFLGFRGSQTDVLVGLGDRVRSLPHSPIIDPFLLLFLSVVYEELWLTVRWGVRSRYLPTNDLSFTRNDRCVENQRVVFFYLVRHDVRDGHYPLTLE